MRIGVISLHHAWMAKLEAGREADHYKAVTALERLSAALAEPADGSGCNVFLHRKGGPSKVGRWRRLKFADGLAAHFRAEMAQKLLEGLPDPADLILFAHDDFARNHVAAMRADEVPEIADWLGSVPSGDLPLVFDGSAEFLKTVDFQCTTMVVGAAHRPLAVFRKRTPSALLRKGGFLASFHTSQHQFSEVKGDVFDFSTEADILHWDGHVFIFNLAAFETLTNIRKITAEHAKEALAGIQEVSGLDVDGLEVISKNLEGRAQLAKRLAAARLHGTIKALRVEALAERIRTRNLPLKVEERDGRVRVLLNPEDRVQVREFVNLITDVYLNSPTTGKEWRAHVKTPA